MNVVPLPEAPAPVDTPRRAPTSSDDGAFGDEVAAQSRESGVSPSAEKSARRRPRSETEDTGSAETASTPAGGEPQRLAQSDPLANADISPAAQSTLGDAEFGGENVIANAASAGFLNQNGTSELAETRAATLTAAPANGRDVGSVEAAALSSTPEAEAATAEIATPTPQDADASNSPNADLATDAVAATQAAAATSDADIAEEVVREPTKTDVVRETAVSEGVEGKERAASPNGAPAQLALEATADATEQPTHFEVEGEDANPVRGAATSAPQAENLAVEAAPASDAPVVAQLDAEGAATTAAVEPRAEAAGAERAAPARQSLLAANAASQVAAAISVSSTQDEVRIELDPPELGALQIKMHFSEQGTLFAQLSIESDATRQLMKANDAELRNALAEAGFPDAQLDFAESGGRETGDDLAGGAADGAAPGAMNDERLAPLAAAERAAANALRVSADGGVDIRV